VAQLQADKTELAQRIGFLQAELQQRDETIRALQAPREEPTAIEAVVAIDPVGEPPRPPWWRRFLLGE
jgi:hypothetical protein